MNFFNVVCKKGDEEKLDGILTVYAFVNEDIKAPGLSNDPIAPLVVNNLIVAQGNYKEQGSFKEFLLSEFDGDLEKALETFVGNLDGLESALDPKKLKEQLANLDEMNSILPTPAKFVAFGSENEILQEEGDIYFLGTFEKFNNASLAVNAFPLFYQATFRELQVTDLRGEIESLLSQIETGATVEPQKNYRDKNVNVEKMILNKFIPDLLYNSGDASVIKRKISELKLFLSGYQFTNDIEKIIDIATKGRGSIDKNDTLLLELYSKKIAKVRDEDFTSVDLIQQKINKLLEVD